jgi:catalase
MARPGDGGVRAKRIAIIVGKGVDGPALQSLARELLAIGAVPRFVGAQLGPVPSTTGELEVDTSIEATPSVLFDAVVVSGSEDLARTLSADGRVLEFLKDQYRHCKPILALGAGEKLLSAAGIPKALPNGRPDPGLIVPAKGDTGTKAFITALRKHKHFERETDPPRV